MPGAPKILQGDLGMKNDPSGRARRARFFAEWVVDKENPLTARVMANRIWQHVFGVGIVATGSDLEGLALCPHTLNYLTGLLLNFPTQAELKELHGP